MKVRFAKICAVCLAAAILLSLPTTVGFAETFAQPVENGYYYMIAQNGQKLCEDGDGVRTTADDAAASLIYLCKDADQYEIVFASDKRLLTLETAKDTEETYVAAASWNGQPNQKFVLAAVDDADRYVLLADTMRAVIVDDATGALAVSDSGILGAQAWTFERAETDCKPLPQVSVELESLDNWETKDDVRYGQLSYFDPVTGLNFSGEISICFQGNSSLEYPKKNYTIKFQNEGREVVERWGKQKKYCLKADYMDPTHCGNLTSSKLAAQMNEAYGLYEGTPNRGQVDGFPIWLTMNGHDVGLYTWNIPKAEWMLGMEKDNPEHLLIGSEGWQTENLMLDENYELGTEWSIEIGPEDETTDAAFARLVHFVTTTDDETFKKDLEEYLNLDACLNYWCFACIANAIDNTSNNLLLATWNGKIWYPLLYDMDACWGLRPGGKEPVYALVYNRDEYNNHMLERIRDLFPEELRQRYAELRGTVLTKENIEGAFNAFVERVPVVDYVRDWQMWNPDGTYVQSLDLIRKRVGEYLPEVDEAFGYHE